MSGISRTRINKAGETIRSYLNSEPALSGGSITNEVITDALRTLTEWRASHQTVLVNMNNVLRQHAKKTNCREFKVTQRLKKRSTVMNKLVREPTLKLGTMQDFAGVRIVVQDLNDLERVKKSLLTRKTIRLQQDYVESPRATGYRGIHLIDSPQRAEYSIPRVVEVQVRTVRMHDWAVFCEELSEMTSLDIKGGKGPGFIQAYVYLLSELVFYRDCIAAGWETYTREEVAVKLREFRELLDPFKKELEKYAR